MQHAGGEPPVLTLHTAAHHADDNVGILQAPTDEAGLESVDAFEVSAVKGEVAAAHALPFAGETLAQGSKRQAYQRQHAIDVAARTLQGPGAEAPAFRFKIPGENIFGERLRQQHAIAANEESRLGESPMRRDEIRPRDAIAVEKNDIA